MNNLKAGFARTCINPKLGTPISGYFHERLTEGFLDDLEANALALSDGNETILFICADSCGFSYPVQTPYREAISKELGIPMKNIIVSATHTHTGPCCYVDSGDELVDEYIEFLGGKLLEVSKAAVADLTDAKMGYGLGKAENISFGRRYVMKDGSIKTNPGVNNPDIVKPLGRVDERVSVVRFDRADGETIVFVNFATHPDVVGGNLISGDWPTLLRKTVEKVIDNSKCIFVNGAQGDVNHVNVHPKGGDFNGMFNDFDDVARGYAHSQHMANVITGGVLQCFSKVQYVDVDKITAVEKAINVPSNMPKKEDMPEAHRINDLHEAGKDSELPYEGMMLTTVVAEARRMVRLENGPENFEMIMNAVTFGGVGFVTIPGEGFTEIGMALKETEGFDMVIPLGLSNGYQGYFPMASNYAEGGYEARSSNFKAGVAEIIIDEGKALLKSLK